ncbi:MAG: choice-of-anchor D domain-containing protein, partial [Halorubrum sp.]
MNRAGTEQVFAVLFAVLMVTSMVAGAVAVSGGVAAAPGDVTHRVNAGGDTVESNDGGPDWTTDEEYLVAGGDDTSSHGQPADVDPSVPDGTSDGIWDEERWDPASGDEMQYEFDVPDGQEVEVRLYFYDGFDGTEEVGDRVFDVSVEDQTIENFDPIEEYGDDTGGMESFTVTSDGTVDVDFDHVTDNPQINAIEIVESEPEPDTLDGPSAVDFGDVTVGDSETEDVTVTNLGGDGDASIDLDDVSVAGADADEFSTGSASQSTLAPGESATIPVTFAPEDAQAKAASLAIDHSGSDSPLEIDLSGEGTSTADVGFSKSKLEGFSAGKPTAIDFGPDGRAYVSTQGGTVYALEVERTEAGAYEVVNEEEIGAIGDIPNHDDLGNLEDGQSDRQITGLTVGGTADEPEVYVSSSDPEISVGQDDDSTDTNSGAISKLTFDWSDDGGLNDVDHEVMVLGLPRSEENHATNGLDLSADEETLYVAQGGHTNKGAPSDNFGHTPEYALSAAILEVDLAQIEENQATSLQSHDSDYPDLDYLYDLPTIQGEELPFGGNNGVNQAELVEDGPVQVYSPGYRNPYDLVVTEDGQVYAADHGPNGGWGGQPADADGNIVADAESVTNHPNEDGSFTTSDELVKVDEGDYGGHAAPIRANPTGADIYDANGEVILDIDESNSPVPESMVNPDEADYIPPTSGSPDPGAPAGSTNTMKYEDGEPILFSPTGGTEEYTASNFGGAMQGDLLQAELGGDVERIELSADGETVTDSETIFNTGGPLGIAAQDDDEAFAGTVWTANHGGNDVTVFEPNDYDDTEDGEQCTGADDPSLDEDGDGYDNADEIDAGSDPCSSASTPADFDDDGTSNLNDPDDDDDGIEDDEDLFAVDSDNGLENDLPATYDFAPSSESGTILDLGFTGVMMNGENYQDLYDPDEVTAGGAANVLTVENVGEGDAYEDTNTQEHAYQVGANADEPFTVETAVNGLPDDAEPFQSQGIYVGTGDQDNYAKLTATGFEDGGDAGSGVQLSTEDDGDFTEVANPSAPTAGSETTLSMTVYPNNGTVEAYYAVDGGEEQFLDETTVPTEWFDTEDGNGT